MALLDALNEAKKIFIEKGWQPAVSGFNQIRDQANNYFADKVIPKAKQTLTDFNTIRQQADQYFNSRPQYKRAVEAAFPITQLNQRGKQLQQVKLPEVQMDQRIKSVFPMINSKETMVSYFNRLAKALESYGGNIK